MKFILCFIIWVTSTSLAYAQPIETVTAQSVSKVKKLCYQLEGLTS
ncbi:hypothetical protein [Pseudoalteromonas sp. FUC4]|nr:hypothetical protein [Pseudoalteromonas sp. FUC4]